MKYALVGGFVLAFAIHAGLGFTGDRPEAAAPEPGRTPVVVELFTSEGCSSCPPADTLLLQLEEQQPVQGAEVIALEEHVDYWNQQGWLDPFSSSDWTARQQDYASTFKGDAVFTPQIVIDGRKPLIAGRVREVVGEIGAAAQNPKTPVTITAQRPAEELRRQFTIDVGNLAGGTGGDASEVWLAITEKALHSEVSRGENAGKDVRHASVVRWMHRIGVADPKKSPSSFTGDTTVKFKSNWKLDNLRVIAFVQEKRSRHILGAVSQKIGN